ncbi:ankyrin repeat-containing domain protein [Aspergillus multicolor]|uniref:ankyrin repeat-containing domain protein n=1 Tax=Aspergillus multicolor TaxID=41759 RepID=UPI003CCD4588
MPLHALPDDIIAKIASHIASPADLASFARTNSHFFLSQTPFSQPAKTPCTNSTSSSSTQSNPPTPTNAPSPSTPAQTPKSKWTAAKRPSTPPHRQGTTLSTASSTSTATAELFLDLARKGLVNVNAKAETGATALHRAAMRDRADLVRHLVSLGADPDPVEGDSRSTPLMYAARARSEESADLFLALARRGLVDPHLCDMGGRTALHGAAGRGRVGVVRRLLELGVDGVDGNVVDGRGDTPLVLAVRELKPVARLVWQLFGNAGVFEGFRPLWWWWEE